MECKKLITLYRGMGDRILIIFFVKQRCATSKNFTCVLYCVLHLHVGQYRQYYAHAATLNLAKNHLKKEAMSSEQKL